MTRKQPTKISFWDTFNDLMVYDDEVAIKDAFGAEVGEMVNNSLGEDARPLDVSALRAMALVHFRHNGAEDPVAEVRGLTRTQLSELFLSELEDAEDAIPEEPDTALGKEDSPAA